MKTEFHAEERRNPVLPLRETLQEEFWIVFENTKVVEEYGDYPARAATSAPDATVQFRSGSRLEAASGLFFQNGLDLVQFFLGILFELMFGAKDS